MNEDQEDVNYSKYDRAAMSKIKVRRLKEEDSKKT